MAKKEKSLAEMTREERKEARQAKRKSRQATLKQVLSLIHI